MSAVEPEEAIIRMLEILGIEKKQLSEQQLNALDDLAASLAVKEGVSKSKPQPRMQMTMSTVAEAIGMQWKPNPPRDHPYGAELDGVLLHAGKQIAVVELEAIDPKHARAALLDLLTHPQTKKILVLGRSERAVGSDSPSRLKEDIKKNVLPAIRRMLASEPDVGIFSELQLRSNPSILSQFLLNC